jgi:hypothetical protein
MRSNNLPPVTTGRAMADEIERPCDRELRSPGRMLGMGLVCQASIRQPTGPVPLAARLSCQSKTGGGRMSVDSTWAGHLMANRCYFQDRAASNSMKAHLA